MNTADTVPFAEIVPKYRSSGRKFSMELRACWTVMLIATNTVVASIGMGSDPSYTTYSVPPIPPTVAETRVIELGQQRPAGQQ